MIVLTRLDKRELALNCDLIESVDSRPDTTIRLVTGQSLVVLESVAEVIARIRAWRTSLLRDAGIGGQVTGSLTPTLRAPLEGALEQLSREASDESEFAA